VAAGKWPQQQLAGRSVVSARSHVVGLYGSRAAVLLPGLAGAHYACWLARRPCGCQAACRFLLGSRSDGELGLQRSCHWRTYDDVLHYLYGQK
jgi:hypothetical protein